MQSGLSSKPDGGKLHVGIIMDGNGPNGVRQYAWWILNFGVCIGALVLFQRRRKAADG